MKIKIEEAIWIKDVAINEITKVNEALEDETRSEDEVNSYGIKTEIEKDDSYTKTKNYVKS